MNIQESSLLALQSEYMDNHELMKGKSPLEINKDHFIGWAERRLYYVETSSYGKNMHYYCGGDKWSPVKANLLLMDKPTVASLQIQMTQLKIKATIIKLKEKGDASEYAS